MLPADDKFPYTVRVVCEIIESNGSSSMASVCGTSLALMDAGVPLAKPVAGIAMGLIKEGERFAVLSDILGDEDHLGDMDFKVAGTADGITALQMDIKIEGITEEIMKIALDQAKDGRLHILGEMAKALDRRRAETRRVRSAHRGHARSRPTRSAKSSAPAARSSATSSRRPAPRSTSRTTARSTSLRRTPRRSRRRRSGSTPSSPSRKSARSTKARSSRPPTSALSSTSSVRVTASSTSRSLPTTASPRPRTSSRKATRSGSS